MCSDATALHRLSMQHHGLDWLGMVDPRVHRGRYQTLWRLVALRLLIEPTILFPLGTSVVSAKGAHDNVIEELCVLCCSAPFCFVGLKGQHQHLHPTAGAVWENCEGR